MSTLKSEVLLQPQEIFSSSSTQGATLGQLATAGDGRYYRYVLAGGTTLVAGKTQQSAAEDTTNWGSNGTGLSLTTTAAIGATSLTITTATTNAANVFANGIMNVAVTPGQGYTYGVASNSASSGGNMTN